eukprot:5392988-Pleurochrysis_carterae.AAC.1
MVKSGCATWVDGWLPDVHPVVAGCAQRAQTRVERGLADKGHRAHRRNNALGSKAGEDRVAQLPASLGAK